MQGRRRCWVCTWTIPRSRAADAPSIEITVHRSVTSRSEFDRAVRRGAPGGPKRLTYPLSSLGVNKRGNYGIAFGLSGSGRRAVAVDEPGVYPIEVRVVDAGEDRTAFVTWMVVVDPDNTRRNATAASRGSGNC